MKRIIIFFLCLLCCLSPLCAAAQQELPFDTGDHILLLIEPTTDTVIFAQNENKEVPIASVTKIMTLLIVFDKLHDGTLTLEEQITISKTAASTEGSQAFLDEGSTYTVSDLLKTIIISSANDSCVALAEHISGSETNFVKLMNAHAQELEMANTSFMTCTGLPFAGQYSTAHDVAIMSKELLQNDIYFTWSTTWMDTLTHPSGRETELTNTNRLVRFYDGADGLKTGFSSEAGFCLSATAKRGNMRLLAVLLGYDNSKQRFADAQKLLSYGFDCYELTTVVKAGETVAQDVPVVGGNIRKTDLIAAGDLNILTKKGVDSDYSIEYALPESISAPISGQDPVGQIRVTTGNKTSHTVNVLISHESIPSGFLGRLFKIISFWQ